jgi:hypothetical protein
MLQRLSRTADAEDSFIILDKPEENYIPNICINATSCVYTDVRVFL